MTFKHLAIQNKHIHVSWGSTTHDNWIKSHVWFFCLLWPIFYSSVAYCQTTITHKVVKQRISERIDSVHNQIFAAIQLERVPIFDYEGNSLKPTDVLSDCISVGAIDCDSAKASLSEFRRFRFDYVRTFDYNSLSIHQKIESIHVHYRAYIAGVDFGAIAFYHVAMKDLQKILPSRDWEFLKLLGASYCQNPYYPGNIDSVTYSNGYKDLAMTSTLNDFSEYHAEGIKETLNKGFEFTIKYDSLILNTISKVLFFDYPRESLDEGLTTFYMDSTLKRAVKEEEIVDQLFRITLGTSKTEKLRRAQIAYDPYDFIDTTFISLRDRCFLHTITVGNRTFCQVVFSIHPEDFNKKVLDDVLGSVIEIYNEPMQTYYIKPESLENVLGKFQFIFLKNLFDVR